MGAFEQFQEWPENQLLPKSLVMPANSNLLWNLMRNIYPVQTKKQYFESGSGGRLYLLGITLVQTLVEVSVLAIFLAGAILVARSETEGKYFIAAFLAGIFLLFSYVTYRTLPLLLFYLRNFKRDV